MSRLKKFGLKSIIYISLGVIIGGGIGSSAFFIFTKLKKNKIPDFLDGENILHLINEGKANQLEIRELTADLTYAKSERVNINWGHSWYHGSTTGRGFYLGEDGLAALEKKINDDLGVGPEIALIKRIIITGDNVVSSDLNGGYYGITNEIVINSKNLSEKIPANASAEDRAEAVFEIIFHEYGHHIAYSYMKKYENADANVATWYAENGSKERISQYWDKKFSDRFRQDLYYDEANRTKYPIASFEDNDGTTWNTLGSIYSAGDIFDIVNGTPIEETPDFSAAMAFEHVALSGPSFFLTPYQVDYEGLKYLFSLDELFARKYQQLNMPIYHSDYFDTKGIIPWVGIDNRNSFWKKIAGTFLEDTTYYQLALQKDDINPPNLIDEEFRFLQDGPFNTNGEDDIISIENTPSTPTKPADITLYNRTKDLYELMVDEMGAKNGSDISLLWSQNDSRIISGNQVIHSGEKENIKFGGFIDQEYDGICYTDENGVDIFLPILIADYNYRTKENLLSETKMPLDPALVPEDKYYVLKNWVSFNAIKNKSLYFYNEENGAPIKVAMVSADQKANTYYSQLPENLYSPIEALVTASGDVIIQKK